MGNKSIKPKYKPIKPIKTIKSIKPKSNPKSKSIKPIKSVQPGILNFRVKNGYHQTMKKLIQTKDTWRENNMYYW